jgi:ferredoxin-NADP reductase
MSVTQPKKRARVARTESLGADTRLVELVAEEPLGFIGGQFVTLDSGLVLPSGKPIRRAYSILTADREQRSFEVAAKRIPNGPCSAFVHGLDGGGELCFTGPWGKFFPPEDASGPVLVLASDTGVSAALGLLQGRRFERLLGQTFFFWFHVSPDYFLPEALVRSRIPAGCREVRIQSIPPIGEPERVSYVRRVLASALERTRLEQAYICGDGAVNYALMADLIARGVSCTRDQLESFFNMPKAGEPKPRSPLG